MTHRQWRKGYSIALFALLLMPVSCDRRSADEAARGEKAQTVSLAMGGEHFELDLALDPGERHKGLGGRAPINPNGGMLFVLPRPKTTWAVMRDSLVLIDVAFLDDSGLVLVRYTMKPEPPRREAESDAEYEARLTQYPSRFPVQFALETAGGRLTQLGIVPGNRIMFDRASLVHRAR